jgi:hypothetical protein
MASSFLFHFCSIQVSFFNIEAHRKKIELKYARLQSAKTFFLGQIGSSFNVLLIFYLDKHTVNNYEKHLSEDSAQTIYNLILIAIESIAQEEVSNGILVHNDATNFFERNTWEFDGPLMKRLADNLRKLFGSFITELPAEHFFKMHSVKVIAQKYGQNQSLQGEAWNQLGPQLNALFCFEKCAKVQFAFAENLYQKANGAAVCPFFDLERLRLLLPDAAHKYGKLFSSKIGNFQTSSLPSSAEKILHQFEQEEFAYFPHDAPYHATIISLQGYNTSKMYLRKQKSSIPFSSMEYTRSLCKDFHSTPLAQKRLMQSQIYQNWVFKNLFAKIEELSQMSFCLRLELVYSFDCSDIGPEEEIDFAILMQLFKKLHCRMLQELLSSLYVSMVAFDSSLLFGSVYAILGFFRELLAKITSRHRLQEFSSFGDLELASTIEKLAQYMFTGFDRDLSLRCLELLRCKNSSMRNGWLCFDPAMVDNSSFSLDFPKYMSALGSPDSLSSRKLFVKANKKGQGIYMGRLVDFEIAIATAMKGQLSSQTAKPFCSILLELLQPDFKNWLWKAARKRTTEQFKDLASFIRNLHSIQVISENCVHKDFFCQFFVKKSMSAQEYFKLFVKYVEKHGGSNLPLNSVSSRTFDNLRAVLKPLGADTLVDTKKAVVRAFCEVHREKEFKYYPLIYPNNTISKYYAIKVSEPGASDHLWITLNPARQETLDVAKVPFLKPQMQNLGLSDPKIRQLLQRFDPQHCKEDALAFLKAVFGSIQYKTRARRAKYISLYVAIYLGVKHEFPDVVKHFSRKGRFSHADVKGSYLVAQGICTGDKHGNGFMNLKLKPGLDREFDRAASLAANSRERYYQYFGYSSQRLRRYQ